MTIFKSLLVESSSLYTIPLAEITSQSIKIHLETKDKWFKIDEISNPTQNDKFLINIFYISVRIYTKKLLFNIKEGIIYSSK